MTFAAPWALGVAAAAALAAVALHFIATRRAKPTPLPTARFLDDATVRSASRARRLSDVPLLLLRLVALLALGAGFAGPRPALSASAHRIWLVDRSRAVLDMDEVRRAVAPGVGDVLILFDSVAIVVPVDSLRTTPQSGARGSLSAAFAAALREVTRANVRAESITVLVVSPSAVEEVDSATVLLKSALTVRVRWTRVASTAVRAAERRTVRAMRASDSAWTQADDRVLVLWPTDSAPIAARAVSTERSTLVAQLGRKEIGSGVVVARWEDGAPAVVERAIGRGCVREVGVRLPGAGDVQFSAAYRAFDATLGAPCGNPRTDVDSSWMQPTGGTAAAIAIEPLNARAMSPSPWARWLIALGFVLLLAETVVRRRRVA